MQESCFWITVAGVQERDFWAWVTEERDFLATEERSDESYLEYQDFLRMFEDFYVPSYPDYQDFLRMFEDFYVPRMDLPLR